MRKWRSATSVGIIALLGGLVGHVASPPLAGAASSPDFRTSSLNAALEAGQDSVDAPAAQAAIIKCGQVVWSGAVGVKSLALYQPVTPSTPFMLASTTKTMTATMIMSLVQHHRLSLDTRLSQFYPQLPGSRRITIRMLLRNTSGLPEYSDNPKIADIIAEEPRHHWTTDEIVTALSKMKLKFAPGTKFLYTNSNWVVLGGIIQKLVKVPLDSYFRETVAEPAGMTQSTFTYQPSRSNEFAHPYVQNDKGTLRDQFVRGVGLPSNYWGPVFTDGGLASTALDLARFGNALFSDRLVNEDSVEQMADLGRFDYGLGITDGAFDGHTWLGHNGAYGGYESENWTDQSRMVTITVTTNVEEADNASAAASETIWEDVVKAYDKSSGSQGGCPGPGKV